MTLHFHEQIMKEFAECGVSVDCITSSAEIFQRALAALKPTAVLEPDDGKAFFRDTLDASLALLEIEVSKAILSGDTNFLNKRAELQHALHHWAIDSLVEYRYSKCAATFGAAVEELLNNDKEGN